MQPLAFKKHRRRRLEEIFIVTMTMLVMGALGFLWLLSVYGGHL
jgi:hypothetical protein